MHRLFKTCSIIVSCLILFGAWAFQVYAQSSAGLKIQPAIIEDNADPGETFTFSVNVTNISSEEKTFYLTSQNIKGLNDEGLPVFSEEGEATPYELSSWVSIGEDSVTIGPSETKEIPFTIQVPENATPGAHFGGVFLDFQPPKLRETGASIGYKVGSIIHLRISGEAVEEARIREFSTEKLIYSLPDVGFKTTVENLGNVFIRPHGLLEITDMFGKEVSNISVNEEGAPIFPLSERDFQTEWNYDEFAFGRYQAILSLVYGNDGRKTISRTLSFWVLPLKPLIILFGSVLGLILLVVIMTKMHIRKKLREMGALPGTQRAGRTPDRYYRQDKPSSRLTIITIALLIFLVVFLAVLFLLFA